MVIDSLLYEIGLDTQGVKDGLAKLQASAQLVDSEFNGMASRWGGVIQGLISNVIAPVAGAFAVGKVINSYMSDVSEVATLTGAYNQKLDEWRIKRAQLARVTKEDIAIYKQYKEAMTGFNIAIADVSAKLVRTFSPVMKKAVDGLKEFTKWINRNQDNIVRFLLVTAGVLTSVFLPAILKTSAALLMSPLTWLIGALGVLVLIVDDLTTYLRGGQSALAGFWSYFGTGPEILAKLNSAFDTLKQVLSVIWKPLALIATGFAVFKIAGVFIKGLINGFMALKAVMTALAAHPLLLAFTALASLIVWITDAFNRAGGDWSKVMGLMAQDLRGFLNLFGGFGDYLATALADFKGFFSALGTLVEGFISTIYNTGRLIWAFISGAPDEIKDQLINALSELATNLAQSLNDFLSALLASLYTLLQYAGRALESLGGVLLDALSFIVPGFIALLGRILALIGGMATAAIKALGNVLARMAASIFNTIAGVFKGIGKLLYDVFAPIPEFIGAIVSNIIALLLSIVESISSALNLADKYIKNAFKAIYQSVWQVVYFISKTIRNAFSEACDYVSDLLTSIASFFADIGSSISDVFSSVWETIKLGALAISETVATLANNIVQSWQAIKAYFGALVSDLGKLWSNHIAAIKECLNGALESLLRSFENAKAFVASIAQTIAQKFENAFGALSDAFTYAYTLIFKGFDKLKDSINSLIGFFQDMGSYVAKAFASMGDILAPFIETLQSIKEQSSQVFSALVDTITNAFDNGLDAALNFFNSIFDFFAQIPAKIAQAFDISGLIDGAKEKLKGIADDAMGSVKSFFGFGEDTKTQEANIKATKQAVHTAIQDFNTGMAANSQILANTPTVANTSSITNSTYNTDNSRRADNKQNVNNTININVPNGTDARGIVREAQKSFNNLNASNNMVMASEYGNYNN